MWLIQILADESDSAPVPHDGLPAFLASHGIPPEVILRGLDQLRQSTSLLLCKVVYLSPADNAAGLVWSRLRASNRTIMTAHIGFPRPGAARVPCPEAHLTYSLHHHPTDLPLTALVAAATVGPGPGAPRAASTPDRGAQRPWPASPAATAWLSPGHGWVQAAGMAGVSSHAGGRIERRPDTLQAAAAGWPRPGRAC